MRTAAAAQVIEDLEVGAALGPSHAYHHADVVGADGQRVGRVRYGFTFRRPLENLLREFKAQVRLAACVHERVCVCSAGARGTSTCGIVCVCVALCVYV